MKILFAACALLCTACASLTPTQVSPPVTEISNTAMALVAAQSGDCTVPITAPSVAGACAAQPVATTTVAAANAAFQGCVAAAVGYRLSNQAAALQAALCAKATSPAAPVTVTVPAKP